MTKPAQSYGASPAIWDRTALPVTATQVNTSCLNLNKTDQ